MSDTQGFKTIAQMDLKHLPNNAKLLLQRQTGGMIPSDKIQFGMPTTFVNETNNETVWNRGPSIQLEQIPQLIEILQKAYEEYSGKKIQANSTAVKTNTFADTVTD